MDTHLDNAISGHLLLHGGNDLKNDRPGRMTPTSLTTAAHLPPPMTSWVWLLLPQPRWQRIGCIRKEGAPASYKKDQKITTHVPSNCWTLCSQAECQHFNLSIVGWYFQQWQCGEAMQRRCTKAYSPVLHQNRISSTRGLIGQSLDDIRNNQSSCNISWGTKESGTSDNRHLP